MRAARGGSTRRSGGSPPPSARPRGRRPAWRSCWRSSRRRWPRPWPRYAGPATPPCSSHDPSAGPGPPAPCSGCSSTPPSTPRATPDRSSPPSRLFAADHIYFRKHRSRARMIKEGTKAPAFSLESSEGDKVSLKDLKGKKVVLYFYPKDDTPGCTLEAQAFRDSLPRLKRKNAVVLGVSRDSVASHCKFRDKYGLTFPLLSDPEGKVIEAYGAWGEKNMYGKKSLGVIRTTVVIDAEGKVAKVFPRVKVAGHAEEVLAVL